MRDNTNTWMIKHGPNGAEIKICQSNSSTSLAMIPNVDIAQLQIEFLNIHVVLTYSITLSKKKLM